MMDELTNLPAKLVQALTFFSRLPLPAALRELDQNRALNECTVAFPLAGLLIGAITAFVWLLSTWLLPTLPAAAITIGAGLLITGALHEDGLADCADGLGATPERDRALEIMRDSQIGTYGALALLMSVLLRVAALATLPVWMGVGALLISHSTARAAISLALHYSAYARPSGLGETVREGISYDQLLITLGIALAITLVTSLIFMNLTALLAMLLGLLAAWGMLAKLKQRLGGYTGDGLGAMEQICEITMLLTLAALFG